MELESVLVTGANRGIGLEFVKQLVELPRPPKYVFATYRRVNTTEALEAVKNSSKQCEVILINMDVTNTEHVRAGRETIEKVVGDHGLTMLINNAGVGQWQNFYNITHDNLLLHFNTNTVAPIMITREMLPLLEKAANRPGQGPDLKPSKAAIITISSTSGCIERTIHENKDFLGVFGYKISKAALNMAMRTVSALVKEKGILVVQINPGWVRTDMGTQLGHMDPPESVRTMLQTISEFKEQEHGAFIDFDGTKLPF